MHLRSCFISCAALCATGSSAFGDVVFTTSFGNWTSAAPAFTTLDFVDLTPGEYLDHQYLPLGVDFADGGIAQVAATAYPQDSHGISGGCLIDMLLDAPAYAVATHYPGNIRFQLYSGGTIFYQSPNFGTGYNNFLGVVSSVPFDRVVFLGVTLGPPACDLTFVDNIYFASVPGPGAVVILGFGLGCAHRRRRC